MTVAAKDGAFLRATYTDSPDKKYCKHLKKMKSGRKSKMYKKRAGRKSKNVFFPDASDVVGK